MPDSRQRLGERPSFPMIDAITIAGGILIAAALIRIALRGF